MVESAVKNQTEVGLSQMANAIRALSMDAVEQANSGHPGMPMGMADVATVLFTEFLKFNPQDPKWPDRDRFVLSAGHGSMLLYSLLYLTGYEDMTLEEIKNFRQWGAKTAGHPEYGHATGIETTTGPLGQGIANAVGMAMAEKLMAARFPDVTNHYTYTIAGDGCLQEGISQEAISLAGHLKLSKLIVLWDDNKISIDGPTSLSTSEDQLKRFEASGWHVQEVDGHDYYAIAESISVARANDKPSMIACRTKIGYGAPTKEGTSGSHGSPLGKDELAGAKSNLSWSHGAFEIPADILNAWREIGKNAEGEYRQWQERVDALDGVGKAEFQRMQKGELPDLREILQPLKASFIAEKAKLATRQSSQKVLDVLTENLPELIGGSADLTGSNGTKTQHNPPVTPDDFSGSYIHYGIREHAMQAAMNGMTLHGGFIPYGGTFLVFSDYARPALRLAALMGIRNVFVGTHDSIGLGEDGPTHQPIEHLSALRAIPNLYIFRPADSVEVAECWEVALGLEKSPSVMSLTRQGLPLLRDNASENLSARGGYLIYKSENPKATILSSGSEVSIAVEAAQKLAEEGVQVNVASIPCMELFEQQSDDYKKSVLGDEVKIAVEAAGRMSWDKYLCCTDKFIGMDGFGASAPAEQLYEEFGITGEAIIDAVKETL
ncbi:MAG: transketolase [Alphaproteobacteria bacterium CG11_big_fil_rev_8_21_14_0_20_44_7]|nr:MAG: transketolase [Alphaproteobacteria bacterium CG11_big_fil_rev_8_21_14_0_20_44_7]